MAQKNTKHRFIKKLWQDAYIFEVSRGVLITLFRALKNVCLHPLRVFGLTKEEVSSIATVQYPDERRPYAPRYRGRHRLVLAENGQAKCTACFMCATACPAKCIFIEAAENSANEKFPKRYEINTLKCIYCGMCVEACPVEAIKMDYGLHPQVYPPDIRLFFEDKEMLLQRSQEMSDKKDVYVAHMEQMREVEAHPHDDPFLKLWKSKR